MENRPPNLFPKIQFPFQNSTIKTIYSGHQKDEVRCWAWALLGLIGYISCQLYLIFLRKAIFQSYKKELVSSRNPCIEKLKSDNSRSPSSCQLSTVNCQLSTVNCQLSTVNCQLSTE
ncbi:MAG: hypothetical protein EAZ28_24610 [Oscillatoriales cyanobacterium]|nr:MAG: hypothetical protein EAZ28_24610 [Oscillatoriales cyanobacterium]